MAEGTEEIKSCPCLYLDEPCQKDCTCVNVYMSNGCLNCCTYGSFEQRKKQAKYLNSIRVASTIKN